MTTHDKDVSSLQVENAKLRQHITRLEQTLARMEGHQDNAADTAWQQLRQLDIFYALTENSPDSIGVIDTQGILIYANPAFRRIMCYEGDASPLGKHANTFYAESAEKLAVMRQHVVEQGSWHGVLMYRRSDGDVFPGRVTVFAIYDSNGHIQATAGIARDISGELQTAKALQQSKANLARARRIARLGHWQWHMQNNQLSWTEEVYHIFGVAPETFSVSQENFVQMVHPDDLESLQNIISDCFNNPQSGIIESQYRICRPDGEERVVQSLAEIVRDDAGTPAMMIGTIQDITAHKQMEARIRQMNTELERQVTERTAEVRLFQTLVEHTPDAVGVSLLDGTNVYANPAARAMFGYGSDIIGTTARTLHPPQEGATYEAIRQHILQHGSWQGTVTYRRADESTFPAQVSAVLLPDVSGQPYAIGVIVRDITETVQREASLRTSQEALSASEARYRAISELISDYAYAYRIEPDGTTVWEWITESSARVIGLTPQDIMQGADWSQYVYAADQHLVHYSYEQALAGKATSVEFRLVNSGKMMRWLHTYTQPVWDAEANRVVRIYGAVQDITETKRSEAALREANEQLTLWVQQLEQRNREITLLNEMGDFLQVCLTVEEAYQVVEQFAHQLFAEYVGALYMLNPSRTVVEAVASWGEPPPEELVFSNDACWALRAGRAHVLQNPYLGLRCKHMQQHPGQPYMCVPLIAQGETLGMLHLRTVYSSQQQAGEHWEWLAVMVAGHLALALANLQLRERLRNQSIRDPLTGVFNRRYMEESLEREMRRASRHHHTVGVIMLDIDHFKVFNDTHGHEAGDTLLRALGNVLLKRMRGEDIVCRYGGEEFTIILPEASLEDTQRRAEEVRADCKNLHIQHNNQPLGLISVSLGVACFPEHGHTTSEVLRLADNALYLAKTRGRDCVAVAGR